MLRSRTCLEPGGLSVIESKEGSGRLLDCSSEMKGGDGVMVPLSKCISILALPYSASEIMGVRIGPQGTSGSVRGPSES